MLIPKMMREKAKELCADKVDGVFTDNSANTSELWVKLTPSLYSRHRFVFIVAVMKGDLDHV